MPIYEYHCEDCQRQISVFLRSISNPPPIECRFCHGHRLTRLISRITTPKSEESRLASLGDPSALGGVDENDPKSMARLMKRMGQEMGEDVGDELDAALEEGEGEGEPTGSSLGDPE